MTPEQQAAFIIAQAAILQARIAGMQAENQARIAAGRALLFHAEDFDREADTSGCGHNDVITFFGGGR